MSGLSRVWIVVSGGRLFPWSMSVHFRVPRSDLCAPSRSLVRSPLVLSMLETFTNSKLFSRLTLNRLLCFAKSLLGAYMLSFRPPPLWSRMYGPASSLILCFFVQSQCPTFSSALLSLRSTAFPRKQAFLALCSNAPGRPPVRVFAISGNLFRSGVYPLTRVPVFLYPEGPSLSSLSRRPLLTNTPFRFPECPLLLSLRARSSPSF